MKAVFIDTSALYALADRGDVNHSVAAAFYAGTAHDFFTTNYVFAEILSLITKRMGKSIAVRFGRGLRDSARFHIHSIEKVLEEKAWSLFSTGFKDKDFDLVDCVSFAVMDHLKLRHAFSFDRHFLQAGYLLLPGE